MADLGVAKFAEHDVVHCKSCNHPMQYATDGTTHRFFCPGHYDTKKQRTLQDAIRESNKHNRA